MATGLLGIKPPQNCSCQELISQSTSLQYGWLRKRCRRNTFHARLKMFDWPQYYVVIADSSLYYFKNELSKRPAGAVSLYGYNRVFRSKEIKVTEVPWSFKLEHIQPTMKSFYFSASSEREMLKWMTVIKNEMLSANNLSQSSQEQISPNFDSMSDDSLSWGSSDYKSLEEAIYSEGSMNAPRQSVILELKSKQTIRASSDNDGESSDETDDTKSQYEDLTSQRSNPRRRHEDQDGALGSDGYHFVRDDDKDYDEYWAAVHFTGSKVAASEIINSIACNGVYLVRKSEDGLNVLQVYADDTSKKYRIFQKGNGHFTLSLTNGPSFESLEDLLFHYYTNPLPHTSSNLTVPYKKHPEFVNNEKH